MQYNWNIHYPQGDFSNSMCDVRVCVYSTHLYYICWWGGGKYLKVVDVKITLGSCPRFSLRINANWAALSRVISYLAPEHDVFIRLLAKDSTERNFQFACDSLPRRIADPECALYGKFFNAVLIICITILDRSMSNEQKWNFSTCYIHNAAYLNILVISGVPQRMRWRNVPFHSVLFHVGWNFSARALLAVYSYSSGEMRFIGLEKGTALWKGPLDWY